MFAGQFEVRRAPRSGPGGGGPWAAALSGFRGSARARPRGRCPRARARERALGVVPGRREGRAGAGPRRREDADLRRASRGCSAATTRSAASVAPRTSKPGTSGTVRDAEGRQARNPAAGKSCAAPLAPSLSSLGLGSGWGWCGQRREVLERPRPESKNSPVFRDSASDLKGAAAGSRSWHNGLYAERRGQGGGGAE